MLCLLALSKRSCLAAFISRRHSIAKETKLLTPPAIGFVLILPSYRYLKPAIAGVFAFAIAEITVDPEAAKLLS
jgi:hypothetical protein